MGTGRGVQKGAWPGVLFLLARYGERQRERKRENSDNANGVQIKRGKEIRRTVGWHRGSLLTPLFLFYSLEH